jgi:hypothetical protein
MSGTIKENKMELNIIKQIRALRDALRRKPKRSVEAKQVKQELEKLRPIITRKGVKPKPKYIRVFIEGEELSLSEVAQRYNLNVATVHARYRVGNRGKLLIRPSQKQREQTTQ